MLREIRVLTRLNLCNIYGLNVFRNTKDKKERKKAILMMVAIAFVIGVAAAYVGMLVYGYVTIGLGEVIPAYLVMISSLIILFLGIFKAGAVIFERKGYDILCSLPLSTKAIVVARFIRMYVENLMFTLVVMVPGMVVYGVLVRPSVVFYLAGGIVTLLLPIAPMTVATIIGALITAISSRTKHGSLVGAGFMVILVLAIMALSGRLAAVEEDITTEMLYNLANLVTELISGIYPPAVWLGDLILGKSVLLPCIFVICTFVLLGVTMHVIGTNFHSVCQRIYGSVAKSDFQMSTQRQSKVVVALYKKEFKRYFASNVYVTNTIIGPILATVMCGGLMFAGTDSIMQSIKTLPIEIDLVAIVPMILSSVFCLMTVTATSISMEGKEWWILKSLPLSTKEILDGKLLMNLILMAPFYVVSEAFLVIALKPIGLDLLWVIGAPALLILFSCVWGITANLKFPVFNWENEVAVVKQSMAALVGGMAGMLLALIFALVMLVVPGVYLWIVKTCICVLLAALTMVLYSSNNRVKLEEL